MSYGSSSAVEILRVLISGRAARWHLRMRGSILGEIALVPVRVIQACRMPCSCSQSLLCSLFDRCSEAVQSTIVKAPATHSHRTSFEGRFDRKMRKRRELCEESVPRGSKGSLLP